MISLGLFCCLILLSVGLSSQKCKPEISTETLKVDKESEAYYGEAVEFLSWVDCNFAKSCEQKLKHEKSFSTTSSVDFGFGISFWLLQFSAKTGLKYENKTTTVTSSSLQPFTPSRFRVTVKLEYTNLSGMVKITEKGCKSDKSEIQQVVISRPTGNSLLELEYKTRADLVDSSAYNRKNKKLIVEAATKQTLTGVYSPAACSEMIGKHGATFASWKEDQSCTLSTLSDGAAKTFSNRGEFLGHWQAKLTESDSTNSTFERDFWIDEGRCDLIVARHKKLNESSIQEHYGCQKLPDSGKGEIVIFKVVKNRGVQGAIGRAIGEQHSEKSTTSSAKSASDFYVLAGQNFSFVPDSFSRKVKDRRECLLMLKSNSSISFVVFDGVHENCTVKSMKDPKVTTFANSGQALGNWRVEGSVIEESSEKSQVRNWIKYDFCHLIVAHFKAKSKFFECQKFAIKDNKIQAIFKKDFNKRVLQF